MPLDSSPDGDAAGREDPSLRLRAQLHAQLPDGRPDLDTQREAAAALIEAMRPLIMPPRSRTVLVVRDERR